MGFKCPLLIDSDDELTPDAVSTFLKHWQDIVDEGSFNEFAEVSALTRYPNGTIFGNYKFPPDTFSIDSNWHDMVLKKNNYNEHIVCWDFQKLKKVASIPESFWLDSYVTNLFENIFWARLGKSYKTRYLNTSLRVYQIDAEDSLLRIKNKRTGHYNNLVGMKYFLDENLEYFWWNPKFFLSLIVKFIISSIAVGITVKMVMKPIKTFRLKMLYFLFLPISAMLYIFYNIRGKYWF